MCQGCFTLLRLSKPAAPVFKVHFPTTWSHAREQSSREAARPVASNLKVHTHTHTHTDHTGPHPDQTNKKLFVFLFLIFPLPIINAGVKD